MDEERQTEIERRLDRLERMMLIMTREVVDQRSGDEEIELRRLALELRDEHPFIRRSGAFLILDPA